MTQNQRQFPRSQIQIEVQLSLTGADTRTVITHDMSQGGMLLRLNDTAHYPLGEMVNVRFKDPLQDYEETEKDAIIVRHADNGVAIAFVEIASF